MNLTPSRKACKWILDKKDDGVNNVCIYNKDK